MARETVTRLLDDLDGGVAHETVSFGIDGVMYEIDLSSKNAKKLRSELAVYIDKGSRLPQRRSNGVAPARGARRRGSAAAERDQNRAIREWAQAKGFQVAERGRISQGIVEEFHRTAGR
jgi:hypothetical protein